MPHIKWEGRASITPVEWLPVGSNIGKLVNAWAGRSDIIAFVGPGAGGRAPACFNPLLAEVEVNVEQAFGKSVEPSMIGDLTVRDNQFNWPKASGAIFHEALHARYSLWSLPTAMKLLSPGAFKAIGVLEESRIEAHGVSNFKNNRVFLRACALEIVINDLDESIENYTKDGVRSIAKLAALTCARVDAGSLDELDVEKVKDVIIDFLGQDVYDKLRSVWCRFQDHSRHTDPEPLYALAREWDDIISELEKERGEESTSGAEAAIAAAIAEAIEAIKEAAETVAIQVGDEVQDQERAEDWQREVSSRSVAAKERKDHEKESNNVFAKTTSESPYGTSNSTLKETRMPTGIERAAAVKIAQLLEKAKYRERDEQQVSSILPPGRLRSRAVVQNAAYAAQGSMLRAEPWQRTMRRHTEDPTLKVGVMVDISGSMNDAMQPMAVTAWAMSEAARRVQAKCAMVYFGQDVFPTLKPGEHLSQISVYSASDGTEKFDKAFKALDGALGLLHGTGARLLVIVSDTVYTPQEREKAKQWIARCDREGVAVLILPFSESYHRHYSTDLAEGTSAIVLGDVKDPAQAAVEIGKAAAAALSKVGKAKIA